MTKRFTDTDKWDDPWFRKLPIKGKAVWIFLLDKCNHAGIWKKDIEMLSFLITGNLGEINEKQIKDWFGDRIIEINNKKWLIKNFVDYQYGELNPSNRFHNSIINLLKKDGAYKGLIRPFQGAIYKDKDKDKEEKKDIIYKKYIIIWNELSKNTLLKLKRSLNNQIIKHISNREKENPEFYQLFKNAIEKIKISPNLQKQKWLNFEFMFLVQKSQSGVDKINDGKYDFLEEDEKKPLKTMSEYERGQINKSIKVLTEMGFDNSDAKRLSMIYKNYEIVKLNIEGACNNEDQGNEGQFFKGNIRYAIEINKYGKELKK